MTLLAAGFGQPVEWLAIAGGAALGVLLFGGAAQLLCRWTTRKKLPPLPLFIVRILGGVVAGVITAMFVLTGAGGNGWWPFGGTGNPGNPGQTANTNQNPQPPAPAPTTQPPENPKDKETVAPPSADNSLTVEVLTGQEFNQLKAQDPKIEKEHRYYRLPESSDSKALHTLPEVEDAVTQRGPKPKVQHLFIVGPDESAGWVAPLKEWAKRQGIQVE